MKKIIHIFIIFILAFNFQFALAKKPYYSNITINTINKTISGTFNNGQVDGFVDFSLYSLDDSSAQNIYLADDVPWTQGSFSASIGSSVDSLTVDINHAEFADNNMTVPINYDMMLLEVDGPSGAGIEDKDHVGFLIVDSASAGTSTTATTDDVHTITYDELLSSVLDEDDHFPIISAKLKREEAGESFDVYLIMNRTLKSTGAISKHILCRVEAPDNKNPFGIKYDPLESTHCPNQMTTDPADFFSSDYTYSAYISDSANGEDIANPNRTVTVTYSSGATATTDSTDTSGTAGVDTDAGSDADELTATTTSETSSSFPSYNGTALVKTDCGYTDDGSGNFRMCGFNDAMGLLNRVIDFIFALVLPIAAIVFVYVGFLFISSAAKPDKRTAAKAAMGKLILGIVVIMIAWILIKTILITLGVGDGFNFMGIRN